ncbi:MAG: hypothetical protein A2511_02820 [Deltaproteobacteria bacterium RIFOXYD12_FULL_50_9]|nr:MAG: hypothetical protein A2511_02820 [Deltaproteobacteria bacterium RIFOXYD12_FULL_50_9]
MTNRPATIHAVIAFFLLSALIFFLYSQTLHAPFLFDDDVNILGNPSVRITELNLHSLAHAALDSPMASRPISNISIALNYFFHGYSTTGYHITNIIIHLLNGIFLYLFLKTTLDLLPAKNPAANSNDLIALITTGLWLIHPLQTQSVSYIVQRMNSLGAMFFLISLLLYIKARLSDLPFRYWLYAASCIAALLAFGSKENTVFLPFFIFLYEWYFFQNLDRQWLKRHLLPIFGIILLLGTISIIYLGVNPWQTILDSYKTRDFTLGQRLLTELRVVVHYISLIIFPYPARLTVDYDFPVSISLLNPASTLLSLLVIIAILIYGVRIATRDKLTSFCIIWFFVNLIIESSVIGLEIIYEHRTYLPSMLVILLLVQIGDKILKHGYIKISIVALIFLCFSCWTHERNRIWADDLAFWLDNVQKSSGKARPQNNYGKVLKAKGRIDEAIYHFKEAIRINPHYDQAHYNLGNALEGSGMLEEALGHYEEAIRSNPKFALAHYNMGVVYEKMAKPTEAANHYIEAIRLKSNYAMAYNNLGILYAKQGDYQKALEHFETALTLQPDDTFARQNINRCRILMNNRQ